MAEEQTQPTAEDQQKATQVAVAGATAAQSGEDVGQAMRNERDRVHLKMSDEDIEKIARRFNELNIQELDQRGAFTPPPEPVQPPSAQAAPPPTETVTAPGEEPEPAAPSAPQKRTPAQRFMGL